MSPSPTATWASPGTSADAPRFRSTPTIFEAPPPPSVALDGSPVSRLQPRTIGQLLDGGFEVLRFRFRTIAIVACSIVLPLYAVPQVIMAIAGASPGAGPGLSAFLPTSELDVPTGFWASAGLAYLSALGLLVATVLVGVAVAHLVAAWLMGDDPGPREVFAVLRRRTPATLGAFVLVSLLKIVVGLFTCGIGLLWAIPALSVLAPVLANEPHGALRSIRRTLSLSHRRFATLLAVSLLWALTSALVSSGVSTTAVVVGGLIGAERGLTIGLQAANVVATVVLMVVQVAVTALVYVDLRVRTEGLDLQLEAVERFRAVR